MKVEQLARLVGVGVADIVAVVLGAPASRPRAPARPAGARRPTTTAPPRATSSEARTSTAPARAATEPPLAAMFGNVTHHELHRVVDRWLLGRVLGEEGDNVSHAAKRLGISRRTLREHRDRSHDPQVDAWMSGTPQHAASSDAPPPPSLSAVVEAGGTYRDVRAAVDRWLLGSTLEREQGNVTWAARSLGMSRKDLRARWARVRG